MIMRRREIESELEGLNSTLDQEMPESHRRYWEGYRRAMCKVIGAKATDYPFGWSSR